MSVVGHPVGLSAVFPKAAVETCLLDEFIEAIKAEAAIRAIVLPASRAQIAATAFQVDSLVVVSILCAVESVIGCQLPENVVQAGGYLSANAALGHLLPRIEAQWRKQNGAKP